MADAIQDYKQYDTDNNILRKILNAIVRVIRGTASFTVTSGPSTSTTAATWIHGSKAVAAIAVPEQLVAASQLVSSVTIVPGRGSVGLFYAGSTGGDDQPSIPLPITIFAPAGKKIDLHDIWIDVTVAGESAVFEALS